MKPVFYLVFRRDRLTHETPKLYHIGTSQLICCENQLTGFYMMATLAFNELKIFFLPKFRFFSILEFNQCGWDYFLRNPK